MPKSNLTKKVLAQTFKTLVCNSAFEKVSVSDICDTCQVSRKTFYYHFKDKYALVEWIFDTEFIDTWKRSNIEDHWLIMQSLCQYLYDQRTYYLKLIQYRGQNSFREYFHAFLFDILEPVLLPAHSDVQIVVKDHSLDPEDVQDFYAHFISDALLFAIFRWLTNGTQQSPEVFIALLRSISELIAARLDR